MSLCYNQCTQDKIGLTYKSFELSQSVFNSGPGTGGGGHPDPGPQQVDPHCRKKVMPTILVEAQLSYSNIEYLLYASFKLPVLHCQDLDLIQAHSMLQPIHMHMLEHFATHTALPPVLKLMSPTWLHNIIVQPTRLKECHRDGLKT